MKQEYKGYEAMMAIARLKVQYPEIANIIKRNEGRLQLLSLSDIIDVCRIITEICSRYREPYLKYTEKIAAYTKEIEELRGKLVLSRISADEYNEIEKITNKVVSSNFGNLSLNLNNGVSIIFNSPAKVEDYNAARPSTYADAYSKENKDNK